MARLKMERSCSLCSKIETPRNDGASNGAGFVEWSKLVRQMLNVVGQNIFTDL
jgi:hypothetical protein